MIVTIDDQFHQYHHLAWLKDPCQQASKMTWLSLRFAWLMRRPRWSFQAWRPRKEDEARKQGRLRNKQGGLDLHILGMREARVQEALDRLKPRTQKIKTTTELQLLASA